MSSLLCEYVIVVYNIKVYYMSMLLYRRNIIPEFKRKSLSKEIIPPVAGVDADVPPA